MGSATYQERTWKTKYSPTTVANPRGDGRMGVFVTPCRADTPNAKTYVDKDGNQVRDQHGNPKYRLEFNRLDHWFLSDIDFEERDVNGKPKRYAVLKLVDDLDVCYLELERGSQWWLDMAYRISSPKFRLDEPFSLAVYGITEEKADGKSRTNKLIVIEQGGQKIPRRWTRENDYGANDPDGAPAKAVYDDEEKEWSFKDRDKWIDAMVYKAMQTKLRSSQPAPLPAARPAEQPPPPTEEPGGTTADDDDPPFWP